MLPQFMSKFLGENVIAVYEDLNMLATTGRGTDCPQKVASSSGTGTLTPQGQEPGLTPAYGSPASRCLDYALVITHYLISESALPPELPISENAIHLPDHQGSKSCYRSGLLFSGP